MRPGKTRAPGRVASEELHQIQMNGQTAAALGRRPL